MEFLKLCSTEAVRLLYTYNWIDCLPHFDQSKYYKHPPNFVCLHRFSSVVLSQSRKLEALCCSCPTYKDGMITVHQKCSHFYIPSFFGLIILASHKVHMPCEANNGNEGRKVHNRMINLFFSPKSK